MGKGREALLKSAAKPFARKGYAGASTREICKGAGVTKPVLYYHVQTEEHLYRELVLDCFSQYHKALLRSAKSDGNFRDKLISILENHFGKRARTHSKPQQEFLQQPYRRFASEEFEWIGFR